MNESIKKLSIPMVAVVFLLLCGAAILFYDYPNSADDLMHHLMARFAPVHHHLFLDFWGRPGFTLLHVLPAQLGFLGSQLLSVLLTLLTGMLVGRYCRAMPSPYPALAVGFTLFQTYHFQLAFGAMTETAYALCLAAGLLMMQGRRFALAALLLSWSAVTRLEGMPLLILFAMFFIVEEARASSNERRGWFRTSLSVTLLGTFPVAWNLLLYARSNFTVPLALFADNHFLTAGRDVYGSGTWYDFLLYSGVIHGPVIFVLMLLGFKSMLKSGPRFIPIFVLVFYLLQTILWNGGFFKTAGYHRFFASIAPAAGILSVYGLRWLVAHGAHRYHFLGRTWFAPSLLVTSILWCAGNSAWDYRNKAPSYHAMDAALGDIQANGGVSPQNPILCPEIYVIASLGLDPWDRSRVGELSAESIDSALPGSYIVYAGWRHNPEKAVPATFFYSDDQPIEVLEHQREGGNYIHRLKGVRPQFRELSDRSAYCIRGEDPDLEPWPYYLKIFIKVN